MVKRKNMTCNIGPDLILVDRRLTVKPLPESLVADAVDFTGAIGMMVIIVTVLRNFVCVFVRELRLPSKF
jgi:hypothetical protein